MHDQGTIQLMKTATLFDFKFYSPVNNVKVN